ncbi:hypothetical protein SLA2020_095750 [Shorea laevis]
MEDAGFFTKQQNLVPEKNHPNSSKFYTHFLQKALIVTIFFVILPFFPSQAPEFINQTILNRSWELLHLLFVGITVSYGLFSCRSDETDKENHNNASKFDNAQSYVSRLLHISSLFDDDAENVSGSDEYKVETWSSRYYRNEPPLVVVADPSVHVDKQRSFAPGIGEKPLLLPVRSLKSPVLDAHETSKESINPRSVSRSTSNLGSKRVLNKRKNGELGRLDHGNSEDNLNEDVVLPSPIPWRSRSGRMEAKEETGSLPMYTLPSSMEESDFNRVESCSFRSRPSLSNSTSSSPKLSPSPSISSPKQLSPSPSLSAESQARSTEDLLKIKSFNRSPPPPPPLPPWPIAHKLSSTKPISRNDDGVSFEEKLHRSFRRERRNLKSVRKIQRCDSFTGSQKVRETEQLSSQRVTFMPIPTYIEFPKEEKQEFVEEVLMVETETEEDSETEEEDVAEEEGSFVPNLGMLSSSNHEEATTSSSAMDAASDVDKKADEFIAKIREQIRLQRIDSIKRSSRHVRRNLSR